MDIYKWTNVESLKVQNNIVVDDLIPKANEIKDEIIVARSEIQQFDKKNWKQLKDPKISSDYAKQNFVKSYFSTCIYLLKRTKSLSIASNQSYRKTIEISHMSSFRTMQTESLRLENVTEAGASGDGFSVRNTLTVAYSIENLKEYISENRKVTTEEVNYDSIDASRNIVFWDLVKIIAIYRKDLQNNVELIGFSDYFVETRQKVYKEEP